MEQNLIIKKIWFDGEWLYGMGNDGKTYRQSLLWYDRLLDASAEERENYTVSFTGFHWRDLDEDISFESFLYDEAEPSPMQRFFLTHKELNVAEFAKRIGINASLLRNYINGFKKPSREREEQIMKEVIQLSREYASVEF